MDGIKCIGVKSSTELGSHLIVLKITDQYVRIHFAFQALKINNGKPL